MIPTKIPFSLAVITPFHIGNGDEIDPLSLVIHNDRAYRLHQLEYIRYLLQHHKAGLDQATRIADIKQIHKFFYSKFNPELRQTWIYSYPIPHTVAADYVSKLENASNQGFIRAFIRAQSSMQPFIPGSSIKGSIRTAILSELSGTGNIGDRFDRDQDQKLQARLLKYWKIDPNTGRGRADIPSDPFKFIKFADLPFANEWLSIHKVEVINPPAAQPRTLAPPAGAGRRFAPREQAIPIFMELGMSARETRILSSELTLSVTDARNPGIREFLPRGKDSLPEFIRMIRNYYRGQFAKEESFYLRLGESGTKFYHYLKNHFQEVDSTPNQCMLKIGLGSGQNYCTYASLNYAPKSRKMVSHYPLGWFKLSFGLD